MQSLPCCPPAGGILADFNKYRYKSHSIYYAGGTLGPTLCGVSADLMGDPAGGVLAAAVISVAVVPIFLLHRRLGRHETMLPRP